MTLRLMTGIAAALILSAQYGFADDLEDLKATEELRLKTVNEGLHTSRMALIHDEYLRITPDYPFPINRARRSNRPDDGSPIRGERHNVYPIDYQYRVVGDTGVVWGFQRVVEKPEDGPQVSFVRRVMLTYTKADGKWKLLARHDSHMPSGAW